MKVKSDHRSKLSSLSNWKEDGRGFPKISEEGAMMLRSYSNTCIYSSGNLKTCENNMIFSRMKYIDYYMLTA